MSSSPASASIELRAAHTAARYIAGDWGTTSLRLYLCNAHGEVIASGHGAGVSGMAGRFEDEIDRISSEWQAQARALPLLLCGAVGSNIGWRETAYLPCPTDAAALRARILRFDVDARPVAIVPGLSCRNSIDAADFMRGEETQIIGALRLRPELSTGRHLVGLPGTHSKWVVVEHGRTLGFSSTIAGECYAALADHSVLLRGFGRGNGVDRDAFELGLDRVARLGAQRLLQLGFETRARQLSGELGGNQAAGFLSGLCIGADVDIALAAWADHSPRSSGLTLIGSSELIELYQRAFALRDIGARTLAGDACVLAGMAELFPEYCA